jgi:cell division protein FtsZ
MDVIFPEQNNKLSDKTGNTIQQENLKTKDTVIKIIGVGGGGTNAINRMQAAHISGVQLYAVNTDNGSLRQSCADTKISIGTGLGVGGDPKKGEQYAQEAVDKFKDMLQGANMVFITTGMGGGTGTGAAPVIAKVSKELGILTVGVVTKPFTVEGAERIEYANKGIAKLRNYTDAIIVIPNDKILMVDGKTPYTKGFEMIDDVLRRAIESITDTITKIGEINIDFADVDSVLRNSDNAIIALGGGATLEEAFNEAISNKFVEGEDIRNADKLLVNVSYSNINEIKVEDTNIIFDYIKKNFKKYVSLKNGNIINNDLDTKLKVSIIAAFKKQSDAQTVQKEKDLVDIMKDGESIDEETNPFDRPAYENKTTKI